MNTINYKMFMNFYILNHNKLLKGKIVQFRSITFYDHEINNRSMYSMMAIPIL